MAPGTSVSPDHQHARQDRDVVQVTARELRDTIRVTIDRELIDTLDARAPGLAEAAVTLVLDRDDVYDAQPFTWRDVTDDALRVVAGGLHDETIDAPAGVFVSSHRYRLNAFALDDKHQAAAASSSHEVWAPSRRVAGPCAARRMSSRP